MKQQRIVCAAILYGDNGLMVCGARHFDLVMHKTLEFIGRKVPMCAPEQGFIDNNGKFLNRKEAFKVAEAADQINHKTGNIDGTNLFSEDLY